MILTAIQKRRSVRQFASREVPAELVEELIRAAQFAPSGMNNRAVEFVVLRGPEAKETLYGLLEPKQPFVRDAPVVILPVTDLAKIPLAGEDQQVVAVADIALASSFIMTQAVVLGLGTVWKHISRELAPAVAEAFGLPPTFTLFNAIPIGYPAEQPAPHYHDEFLAAKIHPGRW